MLENMPFTLLCSFEPKSLRSRWCLAAGCPSALCRQECTPPVVPGPLLWMKSVDSLPHSACLCSQEPGTPLPLVRMLPLLHPALAVWVSIWEQSSSSYTFCGYISMYSWDCRSWRLWRRVCASLCPVQYSFPSGPTIFTCLWLLVTCRVHYRSWFSISHKQPL